MSILSQPPLRSMLLALIYPLVQSRQKQYQAAWKKKVTNMTGGSDESRGANLTGTPAPLLLNCPGTSWFSQAGWKKKVTNMIPEVGR